MSVRSPSYRLRGYSTCHKTTAEFDTTKRAGAVKIRLQQYADKNPSLSVSWFHRWSLTSRFMYPSTSIGFYAGEFAALSCDVIVRPRLFSLQYRDCRSAQSNTWKLLMSRVVLHFDHSRSWPCLISPRLRAAERKGSQPAKNESHCDYPGVSEMETQTNQ